MPMMRESTEGSQKVSTFSPNYYNGNWKEEKEMLLALVMKNQQLAAEAQQKREEDIEDLERKYEYDISDLRKEISTLKQENKLLK